MAQYDGVLTSLRGIMSSATKADKLSPSVAERLARQPGASIFHREDPHASAAATRAPTSRNGRADDTTMRLPPDLACRRKDGAAERVREGPAAYVARRRLPAEMAFVSGVRIGAPGPLLTIQIVATQS